ncbi:ComEA family DNA-binding protein [Natronoglycomyces albus]|uniref:ComEA family DNA-binding protein n=1 Tax=Natronoglycomyces albus TaxID=2811108 RepID=A0A895XQD3_9ACTN|nr:ComEA family DNA-binding protein [Natronoglycomyces albus]QSB04480.1 ComEA family DNA-binding protein [Natronoglycomyces albus]
MTTIHTESPAVANAHLRKEPAPHTGKQPRESRAHSGGAPKHSQSPAPQAWQPRVRGDGTQAGSDLTAFAAGDTEWERCCQETIDTCDGSVPQRVSRLGLSRNNVETPPSPPDAKEQASTVFASESSGLSRGPHTRGQVVAQAIQRRLPPRLRMALSGTNRAVLVVVTLIAIATGFSVAALSWPKPADPPSATAAPVAAPMDTVQTTIVVSVAGAVVNPGIVEVPDGARVADAIKEAGGLVDGADPGMLNLARILNDGDLIAVLDVEADTDEGHPSSGGPAGVNVNAASATELTALNGVGPVTAERIVEFRDQNGSFQSAEDLLQVSGIGPAMLEKFRDDIIL